MATDAANTSELIRQARQGDPEATDRLLTAYRNYLAMLAKIYLHRMLPPAVDHSDMVQDALLKAYRGFADFRGTTEPELAAWLRRTLARTIIDAVRRYGTATRGVTRETSLERLFADSAAGFGNVLSASGTTPSQAAQRRELGVVLADALARLDREHREVIVMHSLQGYNWDVVAARMRRSNAAVRMLWTRALKELRPHIQASL